MALAVAPFAHAADPVATAEKSPGDLAHEAAKEAISAKNPDGAKGLEAGFNLFLNFPDHPGVNGLLPAMGRTASRLPEAERAGYTQAINDRLAAELAKPDATDRMCRNILAEQATIEITVQTKAAKPDLTALRSKINQLATRFPQAGQLPSLEFSYAKLVGKSDPAAAEELFKKLSTSSSSGIAGRAAAEVRSAEQLRHPLDIKFTAANGREVDLAKLRGKVVLIDFWATWCVPCIAEIPNLTRVYNEYHEKGFEVVGISFENSGYMSENLLRNPGNAGKKLDTPEQVAEKKAKAKAKLLAFTKKKDMPWPQHFDGEFWRNEIGEKYNIHAIPAMFLLDQEGKVVSTDARGEKLEPLVRKLLGLAP